eukprot:746484-Hanusia_phi.AAC.1
MRGQQLEGMDDPDVYKEDEKEKEEDALVLYKKTNVRGNCGKAMKVEFVANSTSLSVKIIFCPVRAGQQIHIGSIELCPKLSSGLECDLELGSHTIVRIVGKVMPLRQERFNKVPSRRVAQVVGPNQ